jgi:amino acid transporter
VVVSAIAGWALLIALSAAIPNVPFLKGSDAISTVAGSGNPVGLILNSALGVRLGTLLLALAVVAQFYCGMSSVTSNSRMIYAFSRDGAVPFSSLWHSLNKRTRTPVNAIAIGAFLSWCLALPSLKSTTAYAAATSIAVLGLFLAYIIPVYLRWRAGDAFVRGRWHLGRWSSLINVLAILWVAFITILFMLPEFSPVTSTNFNYTPIVMVGTLLLLTIWYMLSVRHWFTGPKVQGSADQLAQIEHDLGEDLVPA